MIELGTPAGKKSVFAEHFEEDFSFGHPMFILTVLTDIQIANRTPFQLSAFQLDTPLKTEQE